MTPTPHRSAAEDPLLRRFPTNYGWFVLATSIVCLIATLPGQTIGVSVVLDRVIEDLGLTRSTVSMAYMIGTLAGAAAMPLLGRLLDRFGPRRTGTAILIGFSFSCFIFSSVNSLATLTFAFALIRGFGQGALSMAAMHAVNLWFVRRRGLAVGLAGLGIACGNAAMPKLMESLAAENGWRWTYGFLSVLLLLVVMPLAATFLRRKPEELGLRPDGAQEEDDERSRPELNLRQAIRVPIMWLLLASGILSGALATGVVFHHFSIAAAGGVNREAAAVVFIALASASAAAHFTTGVLFDRVDPRFLAASGIAFLGTALALATVMTSPGMVIVYGLVLGLSMGTTGAVGGAGYAHYFGRAHLGEIKGATFLAGVTASALGPLPFGLAFDRLGSYALPLWIGAIICWITAVLARFAATPGRSS
jgi:MFS transporter, OFA family, oxalate/formate antiporter